MFGNLTPVVRNLLIINIGLALIQGLFNIDLISIGGLRYIHAETFYPFQFFTYMFIHARGFGHIFGNMLALFIFGPWLERVWGSQRFLVFYLVTGLGAGVLWSGINYFEVKAIEKDAEAYYDDPNPERFNKFIIDHWQLNNQTESFVEAYASNPDNPSYKAESIELVRQLYYRNANIPMVGASGAIFGILMAFGLLFPNVMLMLLIPPIPIKAKYFVLLYGLYELYATIINTPGDNVAHYAHLGGMLFAFILVRHWSKRGFK
jgi:membrane associated rhomboid family serine protease